MKCHLRTVPPVMKSKAHRLALLLMPLLLTSLSCASRGELEDRDTESGTVIVVVDNDLQPSSAVSVWLLPESTRQVLLGSVGPGQRVELEYRLGQPVNNYRLRARPIGGDDIVSNSFSLYGGARVHWGLRSNVAVVVDGRR